jgi:hypothetical protein
MYLSGNFLAKKESRKIDTWKVLVKAWQKSLPLALPT